MKKYGFYFATGCAHGHSACCLNWGSCARGETEWESRHVWKMYNHCKQLRREISLSVSDFHAAWRSSSVWIEVCILYVRWSWEWKSLWLIFHAAEISCVLSQSKKKKIVANDIISGGRPVTSLDIIGLAKVNDVSQRLAGSISGSNKPILILFVANCSWILLDSLKTIKSILKNYVDFC